MQDYVRLSLETHLFFGRIMKEHALFLLAGFPAGEERFRSRADAFRVKLEEELCRVAELSDGVVDKSLLDAQEIVTDFTLKAEEKTCRLTDIPIDTKITRAELRLCAGVPTPCRQMVRQVRSLNRRMLLCLNGFISFKEEILREVLGCRLYTTNYPLLIEHILREAKLYRSVLLELERRGRIPVWNLRNMELFWNQIMMEHAQFIRGLLDPTECELMDQADDFSGDYCRLLEEARERDLCTLDEMTKKALLTTRKYQAFKTAGTEGIIGCQIRSLILPLLADHVLREANHYLRILEMAEKGGTSYGAL